MMMRPVVVICVTVRVAMVLAIVCVAMMVAGPVVVSVIMTALITVAVMTAITGALRLMSNGETCTKDDRCRSGEHPEYSPTGHERVFRVRSHVVLL